MSCSKCNLDKEIVNKHFGLCLECNNLRLHGSKYGKQYKGIGSNKKSFLAPKKPKKFRNKSKGKPKKSLFVSNLKEKDELTTLQKDEIFYEECFNSCKDHKCENCREELPSVFRDEEGKIVARFRYSHIIPKSIASHLRHVLKNINHLCARCHTRWDHGDKYNMKIYSENVKKFPNYF